MKQLTLLTLAALSCGCMEMSLFTLGKNRVYEASSRNPVIEVMCLWEPAEGKDPNGLPSRGFAGQLLFFTPGHPQAVKVDGDIRVYVFDDVGPPEERSRPIRQFDFDSGSWNTFMSPSDLGASYQLFIPYTRQGEYQAHCTVRVRFTPANGGSPVYSKMAPIALPGRPRDDAAQSPQPEGYSVPSPEGAPARTESAPGRANAHQSPTFNMPSAASQDLLSRLRQLEATAASTAREFDTDDSTTGQVDLRDWSSESSIEPTNDPDDQPTVERKRYRL